MKEDNFVKNYLGYLSQSYWEWAVAAEGDTLSVDIVKQGAPSIEGEAAG